jgi:hypothetical protein
MNSGRCWKGFLPLKDQDLSALNRRAVRSSPSSARLPTQFFHHTENLLELIAQDFFGDLRTSKDRHMEEYNHKDGNTLRIHSKTISFSSLCLCVFVVKSFLLRFDCAEQPRITECIRKLTFSGRFWSPCLLSWNQQEELVSCSRRCEQCCGGSELLSMGDNPFSTESAYVGDRDAFDFSCSGRPRRYSGSVRPSERSF